MAQVSCGKLGVGDTCPPAAQPLAPRVLVPAVPFSSLMDSGAWLFPQALGMFSAALASGQLGPLMCQFGLPAEAVEAANKGGKYLRPAPRPQVRQRWSPCSWRGGLPLRAEGA